MNTPTDPDSPPANPSDDEAARLLEVGLGTPAGAGRAPPPSPAEVGGWFPQLEILEVLGQGGMGVVYKARQKTLDRVVALKVLPQHLSQDPAFAERFTREARTLARLQHPHIVGVHEFGEVDGRYYLLMEYVDGVNLRQLMDTQALAPGEALAIVPQICEALQFAHDEGVVHRDIKPENVLLDRAGRVKVADFGLAKLVQRGPSDFTLTGTGQVMGTLHYMAPEQYRTPQDVDHRADIFSLGVVFYEMLTGELPVGRFDKPSAAQGLDARLDEIVMKTLERERDLRYQNARDIRSEVTTIKDQPAAPPPLPVREAHHAGNAQSSRHSRRRERHHDPRDPDQPKRRWSRWALASIACFVVCLALIPAVYEAVRELSRPDVFVKHYHGTVAASWTAVVGMGLSALIGLIATIVTARNKTTLRGHLLALAVFVLSGICVPVAMISGAVKIEKAASYAFGSSTGIQPAFNARVEGARSHEVAEVIRRGVRRTWERYTGRIRGRELYPADMNALYSDDDLRTIQNMPMAELNQKREKLELGMGMVGSEQTRANPASFRVTSIEVNESQNEAIVAAQWRRSSGDSWRLVSEPGGKTKWVRDLRSPATITFPMHRKGGHWVFALGQVQIVEDDETNAERAEK